MKMNSDVEDDIAQMSGALGKNIDITETLDSYWIEDGEREHIEMCTLESWIRITKFKN